MWYALGKKMDEDTVAMQNHGIYVTAIVTEKQMKERLRLFNDRNAKQNGRELISNLKRA